VRQFEKDPTDVVPHTVMFAEQLAVVGDGDDVVEILLQRTEYLCR
jgi:hypothetical protein